MPSEKDLDKALHVALENSEEFRTWFLRQLSLAAGHNVLLSCRSNHPWGKVRLILPNPSTGSLEAVDREGETDVLAVFEDPKGHRHAVHVENKLESGTFTEHLKGRRTDDPVLKCYLPGVPRAMYMPFPFQILQTPTHTSIVYEFDHATRLIYTNGTKHPGPLDFWMGDSRGRWEGDTLVVDVTNLGDQTWFDNAGNYHSDALHIVERYSPIDRERIARRRTRLVVGAPATVLTRLKPLIDDTWADELMVTTMIYDHAARRRSYELLAQAFGLAAA